MIDKILNEYEDFRAAAEFERKKGGNPLVF